MKKTYLKQNVEKVLINIEVLIIMFFTTTIESIGNNVYNTIAIALGITFIIIALIINKFGKLLKEND